MNYSNNLEYVFNMLQNTMISVITLTLKAMNLLVNMK